MLKVKRPATHVLLPVYRNGDGLLCLDYSGVRIARTAGGIAIPRETEVFAGTVFCVMYWVQSRPGSFGVENVYDMDGSFTKRPWSEVWSVARDVDELFLCQCAYTGILRGDQVRDDAPAAGQGVARG